VRKLVEKHFPEWKNLLLKLISSNGADGILNLLGDEKIVRLRRIDWAVDAVEKECHFLPLLAPLLHCEVPVPLREGEPTGEYQLSPSILFMAQWESATPPAT
jgi:aminoglycoside phosphotransferase (APT) family kinase protein